MNNTMMDIMIFKTNIRFKKDLRTLSGRIKEDPRIKDWNVDLMDIDKVLRVECKDISEDEIIQIIEHAGYYCQELSD